MGGKAPDHAQLAPDPDAAGAARRKLAVVKLVLAVPVFFLGAFTLAIAYRMTGRSLGDPVFWIALAPVLAGFAAFVGHALWQLRRRRVR